MALTKYSRPEAKTEVNTDLVATLTLATHKGLLNDKLIESLLFRKDSIGTLSAGGAGSATADFTDYDAIIVSASASLALSFTGLENGDVKYVLFNPGNPGVVLSFSGATDITVNKGVLAGQLVLYEILSKVGTSGGTATINARAIKQTFDKATNVQALAGTNADNYLTPAATHAHAAWATVGDDGGVTSFASFFGATTNTHKLRYRKRVDGFVEIEGEFENTTASGSTINIFSGLPAELRPPTDIFKAGVVFQNSLPANIYGVTVNNSGVVSFGRGNSVAMPGSSVFWQMRLIYSID